MTYTSGLAIGARVFLPGTRCYGVVRFIGATHFASDIWVGVELDTPKGKNSGDVQVRPYRTVRDTSADVVGSGAIEVQCHALGANVCPWCNAVYVTGKEIL